MNIAILGLGTIGSGVYELLKGNKEINVKRILDLRAWMECMTTNIDDIVSDDSIELVVETMGGLHPAREYALQCLSAGKSYVSANKLLISSCAHELQAAADANGAALLFSASCGGGIAFLHNLLKTAKTDRIIRLGGILNGTTNYILDSVFSNGESYDSALKQAQALGYAERDPSSDVDGLDTLRKLMLACAVAFGKLPAQQSVPCYGIRSLNEADVDYAKARGGVIRLIACADMDKEGRLNAFVAPKFVKNRSVESSIRSNVNYAFYTGERIGSFAFTGQGAGKFPTANNVIRDIYSVMQGDQRMFPEGFVSAPAENADKYRFYVRVPGNESGKLSAVAAKTEVAGAYSLIETEEIGFSVLSNALNGVNDTFVMILED